MLYSLVLMVTGSKSAKLSPKSILLVIKFVIVITVMIFLNLHKWLRNLKTIDFFDDENCVGLKCQKRMRILIAGAFRMQPCLF